MRYADGGGLTAQGRARREDVRLQAARLFEQDVDVCRIAKILQVSMKSVYQWRRAWRAGGDTDQRWTLARVAALIARLFHVPYTLRV